MLALRIEFLTGVFMATDRHDATRRRPEWPPHPDRLFSALVAAAAALPEASEGNVPDAAEKALQWLAGQSWTDKGEVIAPQLHASPAHPRDAPDVYMPTNPHPSELPKSLTKKNGPGVVSDGNREKLQKVLPAYRARKALPIPAVVPEDPVVTFLWPVADPREHRDTLAAICACVTYLGRSRSLVRVTLDPDPPQPTHVPDPDGAIQLRVPGANRLKELKDTFLAERRPNPAPVQGYRCVADPAPSSEPIRSSFDRMYIFRPDPQDPALPAVAAPAAARAFRAGLMEAVAAAQTANNLPVQVPGIVKGAKGAPMCAFVALPFVHPRQRHADGSVKGLAVLVPKAARHDDRTMVALGLERLVSKGLQLPGVGRWHLKEVTDDTQAMRTLRRATWRGPSRYWTTAVPMRFGHVPKPGNGGEAGVILDSLRRAGVDPDDVLEITVGRHSPLHGAPPSWAFKPRRNAPDEGPPPPPPAPCHRAVRPTGGRPPSDRRRAFPRPWPDAPPGGGLTA